MRRRIAARELRAARAASSAETLYRGPLNSAAERRELEAVLADHVGTGALGSEASPREKRSAPEEKSFGMHAHADDANASAESLVVSPCMPLPPPRARGGRIDVGSIPGGAPLPLSGAVMAQPASREGGTPSDSGVGAAGPEGGTP